jgi:hypothetical protein
MTTSCKRNAIIILKGLSIAALMSCALTTNVAAEDARIKAASFKIQSVYKGDEIIVTSSDGKKWDTMDSKALKLSASMKVLTKGRGYVDGLGIFLGACTSTGCKNNPLIFSNYPSTDNYHKNKVITFPGNKFPLSTYGIAVPSYGDEILKSCNNGLQSNGATKTYSFKKQITASFSANTRKGSNHSPEVQQPGSGYPDFNGGDVNRQSSFTIKVICKAYTPPPLVLNSVYFVVYKHQAKGCPQKATIDVQFKTSRAGKISFNLYRNDGNFQKITLNSKKDGEFFRAKWERNYTFKKSVDRKYMIATTQHKYSSPWKSMVVKCGIQNDKPSPGGKTKDPHSTHGKPIDRPLTLVPPKRPIKPGIKVAPLPKLVCLGGKVSRNKCFCPARKKKIKLGIKRYRCLNNVVKPKSPKAPFKPGIKVAPLHKPVCLGGKVSRNKCFCPARKKKMKFGTNKYRCLNAFVKQKTPREKIPRASSRKKKSLFNMKQNRLAKRPLRSVR